jgi:DNA-directed RNA polymerase subunit RPC12/RpoP
VKRLTINKQILNDELNVELIGAIDEDVDFKEIIELAQKTINFDFEKVTMINSCGIREWIKFLSNIPATSSIVYKNCPQIIIEQINMVHGFVGPGAKIQSFYAPYYCDACEKEAKIHLNAEQINEKKAPKMNCPHCGNENIEFDAIEAQYFHFLGKP